MFAAALIVFREVLEAALVVTIVLAATHGLPHRGKWTALGIGGGVLGSGLVAALATIIAGMFHGAGQDIVNAVILFIAVALIGWHIVWMNGHGRRIATDLRAMSKSVAEGERHMSILAVVVGLAIMREGSETVLMLQGLWTAGSAFAMIVGTSFGLAMGVLAGALIYVGLLAMPVQRIFTLTNFILVLIAAGMAARGANFLAQADLLPALGNRVWDTSTFVPDQSIPGQFLAALTGYIARPNGIEILFYGATVLVVAALSGFAKALEARAARSIAIAVAVLASGLLASSARAGEVLSPYVVQGEFEFEQQGLVAHDHNPENSNGQNYIAALGYSPTAWWRTELEGEFEHAAGPDQNLRYQSLNSENTFALAEPGEYWIDPAFFFEMDFARDSDPNTIITGFLGATTAGPFAETFNLLLHKDYGPGATPLGFIYSNQLKYRLRPWLEPGFEIFGDTDGKAKFSDQQLQIGPGIFGKIYTFNGQALKYQLAYLFGATPAAPDGAVRWKLEYEFFF